MYYTIKEAEPWWSQTDYTRETLHHEFNHFIEGKYFGIVARPDSQWSAFNEPTFMYGRGGASYNNDPKKRERLHEEHPRL